MKHPLQKRQSLLNYKSLLALCCIYRENEDRAQQSDCCVPANVSVTLQGHTVIVRGPPGSCGGSVSHISVDISLLEGERRGSELTNLGEDKGSGSCLHHL